VLDEEGCWIHVQQGVVTVSQGDRVILEEEKCGGLYKLKEGNSVRGGVSGISLEGSSSRSGASRKTAIRCEPDQSVAGRKKGAHSGKARDGPSHGINQLKAPGRWVRVKGFMVRLQPRKESRQKSKISRCFTKGLKKQVNGGDC